MVVVVAFVAVIIVFVVLPLAWGWQNQQWGPPYPTYYRRRHYARTRSQGAVAPEPGTVEPHDPSLPPMSTRTVVDEREPLAPYPGYRWTWLADLLWLAVLAAIGWAFYLWVT